MKTYGPTHITTLVLLAVVIGLMGSASECGKPVHDKPAVCSTNPAGERHCPLQTGRQEK